MPKLKKSQFKKKTKKSNHVIGNNIIAIFFTFFFFLFLFQISGYNDFLNKLLIRDLTFMLNNPDITYAQKSILKNKNDFRFVNLIASKTPDTCSVLMPSDEMIFPEGQKDIFNRKTSWGIKNKAWAKYYLYPRKLIYVDKLTPELLNKVDYVAIINGYGYEYLDYDTNSSSLINVLPRKKNK